MEHPPHSLASLSSKNTLDCPIEELRLFRFWTTILLSTKLGLKILQSFQLPHCKDKPSTLRGAKGYSWLHSGPCKELQPTVIEFYLAWKSRDWFHLRNVTSNPGTQQHASQPGTFLWSLEHLGTDCQYYWCPCFDVLDRSLKISPIWDQKCRTQDN